MDITQDYSSDDLILDLPLELFGIKFYACKVKDFKKFSKLTKYIIFPKEYYQLKENNQLLGMCILRGMVDKKNGDFEALRKSKSLQERYFKETVNEMCELFRYLTREEVSFLTVNNPDGTVKEHRFYVGKDTKKYISDNNFNFIRTKILKMNGLFEPKMYSNDKRGQLLRQTEEKAIKAKSKGRGVTLGEKLTIVSNSSGKPYSELLEENIIQLNADFNRCNNTFMAITTSIFKSVDSDYKGIEYVDPVIDQIFVNPYDNLWGNTSKMLGGLIQ